MRRTTVAALGAALALGAGLTPAAATQATQAAPATQTSPDGSSALVASLSDSPRALPGAGAGDGQSAKAVAPSAALLPPVGTEAYYRMGGATRYATAVAVSEGMVCGRTVPTLDCWGLGGVDAPVETVFVASGLGYADALGGGPLATGLGSLLLVPTTGTVPAVVKNELARIDPSEIVILGGTGAVSTAVEGQLAAYGTTYRVAGPNRYDTAAQATLVNHEIWLEQDEDGDTVPDGHGLDTVVIASGEGFADALAGGGAAANSRGSLLLTKQATLPAETRAALQEVNAPEVIILGGTGAVSASVEAQVRSAVPTATVSRVGGANRFATAIALSKKVFPGLADEVFLVNAFNFPDALASAPAAGYWNASTLPVATACVTSATRAEASRLDPFFVAALGGTGVVSDNALDLNVC